MKLAVLASLVASANAFAPSTNAGGMSFVSSEADLASMLRVLDFFRTPEALVLTSNLGATS